MRYSAALLFTLLFILGGCSSTTMRSHPTLADELLRINSVVILPPVVEVQLITLTGENESIPEQENEIRSHLNAHIPQRLVEQGFEVVEFDFEQAKSDDEDFAYTITKLQVGYEEIKEDLKIGYAISSEKAKEVKAYVGDAIHAVTEKTGADAILITRYSGYKKSGGQIAKDAGTSILIGILTGGNYIPIQQTSFAGVEAALIDGYTGELLWADSRGGALSTTLSEHGFASLPIDMDPTQKIATLATEEEVESKAQPEVQPETQAENKAKIATADAVDVELPESADAGHESGEAELEELTDTPPSE